MRSMVSAVWTFFTHEKVFADTPTELLTWVTLVTILASVLTWYRHSRCHRSDCRNMLGLRRHGKYPHGHLRLCHVHHPHVPDDGQITAGHVKATTARIEAE